MTKPRILITTSNVQTSALESITGDSDIIYSDRATAQVVVAAGGLPVYLPALGTLTDDDLAMYLELADGVLMTGADTNTNPLYYSETPTHMNGRIDDERDRTDIQLIKLAYQKKLPIFGICKGMQIINVALGGTLYQDLSAQHKTAINHNIQKTSRANLTHTSHLTAGSLLASIFDKSTIHTNGGHQQAVKQLGTGLIVSAQTDDDIIEAYEGIDYPFLLGVQFHPELRTFDPPFFALFERFVAAAADR